MRSRLLGRLRPSPAMVVAFLALAVALGGTSYAVVRLPARSVSTKHLKNGAVTRAKIKDNAVDARKIADNALTGADINESSLTAVPLATQAANSDRAGSAAALDKVSYRTAAGSVGPAPPSTDPNAAPAVAAATASCDPGQRVVGGGVKVDDPAAASVVDSYADAGGGAWSAHVDTSQQTAHAFTVYAICVTAAATG